MNIKSTLTLCLLIIATMVTGQVEIEHLSTTTSPQLKLIETTQNNFTRFIFCNDFTNEEWRISSRAFSAGSAVNKMDFNHYDGSSTTTFLTFNALPTSTGLEFINSNMHTRLGRTLTVGQDIPATFEGQIDVYTEEYLYGIKTENDWASTGSTYGGYLWAHGDGDGNRVGVLGQANATVGEAWGVYGVANSTSGNEIGVYGSATGASGSSWAIYGMGDIYYTGSFTAPSDQRLKKNIKKLQPTVLEKLMSLEVKTYEYDTAKYPSMNFAQGPQIGFLAQDLQELFPETVTEQRHSIYEVPGDLNSEHSYLEILGVDYIKIIPLLTSAIQEQNILIEKVQEENNLLKTELEEIKAMIAELKK